VASSRCGPATRRARSRPGYRSSAADGAARRPSGLSGVGLALATTAVLSSGHAATGLHVLIGAGLQGTFSLAHEHRGKSALALAKGALALSAGVLLGFLISAPRPSRPSSTCGRAAASRQVRHVAPLPASRGLVGRMALVDRLVEARHLAAAVAVGVPSVDRAVDVGEPGDPSGRGSSGSSGSGKRPARACSGRDAPLIVHPDPHARIHMPGRPKERLTSPRRERYCEIGRFS
jgi:hypothetical protein